MQPQTRAWRSYALQQARCRCLATRVHNSVQASSSKGLTHTVKTTFKVQYKCSYGQTIVLVGDAAPLGKWRPRHGQRMKWNRGDTWTCSMDLPAGSALECKYVIVDGEGNEVRWQEGSNMTLRVPATCHGGLPVEQLDVHLSWCKTCSSIAARPLTTTAAAAAAAAADRIAAGAAAAASLSAPAVPTVHAAGGGAVVQGSSSGAGEGSGAAAVPLSAWAKARGAPAGPAHRGSGFPAASQPHEGVPQPSMQPTVAAATTGSAGTTVHASAKSAAVPASSSSTAAFVTAAAATPSGTDAAAAAPLTTPVLAASSSTGLQPQPAGVQPPPALLAQSKASKTGMGSLVLAAITASSAGADSASTGNSTSGTARTNASTAASSLVGTLVSAATSSAIAPASAPAASPKLDAPAALAPAITPAAKPAVAPAASASPPSPAAAAIQLNLNASDEPMSLVLPPRSNSPPFKVSLSPSFAVLMEMPTAGKAGSSAGGTSGGYDGANSASNGASHALSGEELNGACAGSFATMPATHAGAAAAAATGSSSSSSFSPDARSVQSHPISISESALDSPAVTAASAAATTRGSSPHAMTATSTAAAAPSLPPAAPTWSLEYDVYAAAYGTPYIHTPFDLDAYAVYDHMPDPEAAAAAVAGASPAAAAGGDGVAQLVARAVSRGTDLLESAVQAALVSSSADGSNGSSNHSGNSNGVHRSASPSPSARNGAIGATPPATPPAGTVRILAPDLLTVTAASTALALAGAGPAVAPAPGPAIPVLAAATAASAAPEPLVTAAVPHLAGTTHAATSSAAARADNTTTTTAFAAAHAALSSPAAASATAAPPSPPAAAAAAAASATAASTPLSGMYRALSSSSASVGDWASRTLVELSSGRTLAEEEADDGESADFDAAVAQALAPPTAPGDMTALLQHLGTALGRSVRMRCEGTDAAASDLLELDRKIALASSRLYRKRDNLLTGWVRKEARRQLATAAVGGSAPGGGRSMGGSGGVTPM